MPHHPTSNWPDQEDPPSLVTEGDVEEFRKILREEFGEEVDLPEAWRRLSDLVTLVRMLVGPLPEDPDVNPLRIDGSQARLLLDQ